MSETIRICKRTGRVRAIYSDGLIRYIDRIRAEFGLPLEAVRITRASHVEPDPLRQEGGNWSVDLSPVGGPLVFMDEQNRPFITRESALAFEKRWLIRNWLQVNRKESQDVSAFPQEG